MYYGGTIPAYITDNMAKIVPWIHSFDPALRPVVCAPNVQDATGYVNLAKIQDNFAGINYGEGIYASIHSQNPNVLIQGTENHPYLGMSGNLPTWFAVRDNPFVVGHHLWTGVDYLGEGGGLGLASGFLDGCLFRKSWFYFQQAQWGSAPMVHVAIGDGSTSGDLAENWNQSGSVTVTTYTNCDSVDLYVNSTKIGTQNLSSFPNMVMIWNNVPWSSGFIKAIGTKGGVQVATDTITTAGSAAKVILKPDRTTIYADGEDVSCIEVNIVDANNTLVYGASDSVQFTMTGAGRSLGIASGNWTSNEPFKATSRQVYRGKALIVMQSTMTPGTINLTVSSGSLASANLTIATVAEGSNPPSKKGDVNNNGAVDIIDALLVAQYYVGMNPSGFVIANGDVNCSGGVDIVDALLIAQYYVGLISAFPC